MTKQEAAIVEVYTGICMLTGEDRKYVYQYAYKLMGRPVYTHELASKQLKNLSRKDFVSLCQSLTE